MGITLAALANRVTGRLRDDDARSGSYSGTEIDQAIADAYMLVQARLPQARLYTANAFTIAASAEQFNFPTGVQYGGELSIQLASSGMYLSPKTREEIEAFKAGQPTPLYAIPQFYAVWEEADRTLRGICYPGAQVAQACHLFRSLASADLRDTDLDTVTLNLSHYGETALQYMVMSELAEALPDEERARRKISGDVIARWQKYAEVMLYKEECRIHDLESVGGTQRRVS